MLEDIEQLWIAIAGHGGVDNAGVADDNDDNDATSLLFGALKPLSIQQVLSQFLPEPNHVERLVGAYIKMKCVAVSFLHTGQSCRLYRIFWGNPSATSLL